MAILLAGGYLVVGAIVAFLIVKASEDLGEKMGERGF